MSTPILINGTKVSPKFDGKDLKVLIQKNQNTYVCSFVSQWKGRDFFHVREFWLNNDEYEPGKGLSVPLNKKTELIDALVA